MNKDSENRPANGNTDASPPDGTAAQAAEAAADVPAAPAQPPDEAAVLRDRLLRMQADFDNYRKRQNRDRDDHARRATEKILQDLLPVIDHFDLGLQSAAKQHVKHSVIDGFHMVRSQLAAVLDRAGVTPIATEGQPFDPQWHECVTHVHSDEHAENVIIGETRRGYRLGNYLLRPSQVIVSKGSAKPAPREPADETAAAAGE